jgi:hypothetical protein
MRSRYHKLNSITVGVDDLGDFVESYMFPVAVLHGWVVNIYHASSHTLLQTSNGELILQDLLACSDNMAWLISFLLHALSTLVQSVWASAAHEPHAYR